MADATPVPGVDRPEQGSGAADAPWTTTWFPHFATCGHVPACRYLGDGAYRCVATCPVLATHGPASSSGAAALTNLLPHLLPCPFCGGEAEVLGTERRGSWSVRCSGHMGGDCPARAQTRWCDYLTATALWNTRSPVTPPAAPRPVRWTCAEESAIRKLVAAAVALPIGPEVVDAVSEMLHQLVYGNRGASSRVLSFAEGVIGRPGWDSAGATTEDAEEWLRRAIGKHYADGIIEEGQRVRLTLSLEQEVTPGNQVEDFDGVCDPEALDNTVRRGASGEEVRDAD